MRRLLFLLLVSIGCFSSAWADHIIGAQLYYDYVGYNTYNIVFVEYRNCQPCSTCAPYDDPLYIQLFDTAHHFIDVVQLPKYPSDTLPITNSAHCTTPYCVEVAAYANTVVLPYSPGGYQLVYQRCCRTNDITNLPVNTGSTYFTTVPDSTNIWSANSTPRFNSFAPFIAGIDTAFSFDFSAIDPDGDSLVYRLASSYDGASYGCPDPSPQSAGNNTGCPVTASPPPYAPVPFIAPYTYLNPTNNPSDSGNLRIDPVTGILTGVVNQSGIFLVGVAADEYRAGVLIGTTQADFEFVFTGCQAPTAVSEMIAASTRIYGHDDQIVVELAGVSESAHITCYDLQGRKVSEDEVATTATYHRQIPTAGPTAVIVRVEQPGNLPQYQKVMLYH